jgi:hypothetical protein
MRAGAPEVDMEHIDEGTIHAWLDGALSLHAAARVEEHVASCTTCAASVAEARGLIAAASRILTSLDDVPRGVIPGRGPGGGDQLAAIRARRNASQVRRRAWRRTPWMAAAATIFVAVGTATVFWRGGRSTPPALDAVVGERPVPAAQPADSVASTTEATRSASPVDESQERKAVASPAPGGAVGTQPGIGQRGQDAVAPRVAEPSASRSAQDVARLNEAKSAVSRPRRDAAAPAQTLQSAAADRRQGAAQIQGRVGAAEQQQQLPAPGAPPAAVLADSVARRQQPPAVTAVREEFRPRDTGLAAVARAGAIRTGPLFSTCYQLTGPIPGDTSALAPVRIHLDTVQVRVEAGTTWFRVLPVGSDAPTATVLTWRPLTATDFELVARRGDETFTARVLTALPAGTPPRAAAARAGVEVLAARIPCNR